MSRLVTGIGLATLALGCALLLQPLARPAALGTTPVAPAAVTPASVTPSASASGSSGAAAAPSPTPLPPIPPGYRIQVPRLGIDLAILEGDVERDSVQLRTPENYAFHLPGTAIPATGGNAYLYAHARTGMFIALWDARVGDEIWISTPDGLAVRYVVSEIHPRVAPGDVSWAVASAPDRLTLQTSTGPDPGDPRFIVVARPG